MKKLPLIMFVVATVFMSCDKKQTDETQASTATENIATDSANVTTTAATEVPVTAPQNDPTARAVVVNNKSTTNAAPPVQVAQTSGKKPALNPAHGQPYHRCDIAVGAPIDSPAPVQTTQPPVVQQQAPTNFNTNPIGNGPVSAPVATPSVSQNVGPKPATNPPHGEPHHRCDLQVGAPLI